MKKTRKIDEFSKMIGAIDCFNEMIDCGVKDIALGPPEMDRELRDEYIVYCKPICTVKGTQYRECNDALITDLFATDMNKGKFNIIFFKEQKYFDTYEELKTRKRALVASGDYNGDARYAIAYDFGKLLGYRDVDIVRMVKDNLDKEKT